MAAPSIQRRLLVRPAVATGLILLIPLVMTIVDRGKPAGDGWHWGPGSFMVMGVLLFVAGLTYEVLAARIDRTAQRVAVAIVISVVVLGIWVELAVGGVTRILEVLFR